MQSAQEWTITNEIIPKQSEWGFRLQFPSDRPWLTQRMIQSTQKDLQPHVHIPSMDRGSNVPPPRSFLFSMDGL